jgi:hypothetical protein
MDYVLASLNPPSIWNLYPTREAAEAAKDEANTYNERLVEHSAPVQHYEPMTYEAYQQAERQHYLSQPLQDISEDKFHEMFEVLPPKGVRNTRGMFSFLMMEHRSGPYTAQYASFQEKYYTRLVDATDETTWITVDEIQAHRQQQLERYKNPEGRTR